MVRHKAAKLTCAEIRVELQRISCGIACAQSPGALKRYQTRRDIFEEELRKRPIGSP